MTQLFTATATVLPDAYHQYIQDIAHLAPLDAGQDDAFLDRLALVQQGELPAHEGEQIAQRLIEGSLRLVVHIASSLYRYNVAMRGYSRVSLLDLIQTGNMALIECVQKCRVSPPKHRDFSAYAGSYIRYALLGCYYQSGAIALSAEEYRRAKADGTLSRCLDAHSLDAIPDGDDDRPLYDRVEAPSPCAPNAATQERAERLLCSLPEREQRAMRLRYGLDPDDQRPRNYQEIADVLGGCAQTYHNLEQRVLQALQEGVPLKTSPDYYSATEAALVLSFSDTAFAERIRKGLITRYVLASTDTLGVYRKAEIDTLAHEQERIRRDYYSSEDTAARLGMSREGVNVWVLAGKLTRVQVPGRENYGGLYPKEEVDRLVQERTEATQHYYTVEETAKRLGIAVSSVPRWVREGRLHRSTNAKYPRSCYAREEVEEIACEQAEIARDYYTTQQAAACLGLSLTGFQDWALRTGITVVRRTLDGVQDLYWKTAVDDLVQEEERIKATTYSPKEASTLFGVSPSTLRSWVASGKLACVQLTGRSNYGGRYPKAAIHTLLGAQVSSTPLVPQQERQYAYA